MVFPVARSHMGGQMDHDAQEGWLTTGIDVLCWRCQGLTAFERPAYDDALSFRLPSKPAASRNGKSRFQRHGRHATEWENPIRRT